VKIVNETFTPSPDSADVLTIDHGDILKEGYLIAPMSSPEVMKVLHVDGMVVSVIRCYGGTPPTRLVTGQYIRLLGNPNTQDPAEKSCSVPSATRLDPSRAEMATAIMAAAISRKEVKGMSNLEFREEIDHLAYCSLVAADCLIAALARKEKA
jgi:hypothetical protein